MWRALLSVLLFVFRDLTLLLFDGLVRNIADYRSLAYAGNPVVPGVANIYNWQFSAPRTYGARLSVDF